MSIVFFLLVFCFILICIYLPIAAQNLKLEAEESLKTSPPDVIAVLTGDRGRIKYSLHLAEKHPYSKLLISGLYATNSLKTVLKAQGLESSVEEYLNSKAHQFELDYYASNTIENVLNILNYLKKNPNLNNILIISSDYHIIRIKYILNTLNKNPNYNFNFDSVSSDYSEIRTIKILVKEVYKIIKAFSFLLLWNTEDHAIEPDFN